MVQIHPRAHPSPAQRLSSSQGQLAQWLARLLDTQEVTGSNPVLPTLRQAQCKPMKIVFEDENVQVLDKPAGIVVDKLKYQPAHRLDKETSGILILAKNDKTLEFLQKQFKNRKVVKKYTALVVGNLEGKGGIIETLLGRSPKDRRKQKVYLAQGSKVTGKRKAITKYKVLERFDNYTLIEVEPQSGRKHQIRVHFAYLSHPLAGDKMYGFKNQPVPQGLKRQFLHATYLKIELPDRGIMEFKSELPEELNKIIKSLEIRNRN